MMDMKEKILITSVLVFTDKQTGEIKTRLGFLLPDEKKFTSNRSFKGYPEGNCFYDGNLLDKIPNDLLMASAFGNFVSRVSSRDPMKSYMILKDVEYKGRVVSLLSNQG